MKTKSGIFLFCILMFVLNSNDLTVAQHLIKHHTLSNGGSVMSSNTNNIGCTVGQAMIGVTQDASYTFQTGFWYPSGSIYTGIEQHMHPLPVKFLLGQNYPNPFNPTTTIQFMLPRHSNVSLKVFDLLGREVADLIDRKMDPGAHSVIFEVRELSSGVYFYRIQTDGFVQTKKLIVMK